MEGCPPSFSRHPERVPLELLFWGNRVTSENELDPVNFVFWHDLKKSRGATFKTQKGHSGMTLFRKSRARATLEGQAREASAYQDLVVVQWSMTPRRDTKFGHHNARSQSLGCGLIIDEKGPNGLDFLPR